MAKKQKRSALVKKLDRVFSLYVRKRDKGVCITCGAKGEPKYMQAGHYVSRGHYATRWDERNVHCQCMRCNVFLSGNYPLYSEKMIEKYGLEIIRELNRLGQTIAKYSNQDLENLIQKYENA